MKKTLSLLLLLLAGTAFAAPPLRLMSYNVRTGRGMDNRLDYDRTAEVIRSQKVDVVALQEVDSATQRSNGRYTAGELATRLHMHATFAPAIDHDGGKYGLGLLSKEQPLRTAQIGLPGASEARTALLAEFSDYYIVATHWSYEAEEERLESLRRIAALVDTLRDKPIFVLGDLNAAPSTPAMQQMFRLGTVLSDTTAATYPADRPTEVIDYIFGWNNGFSYRLIAQTVVVAPEASDHRPLVVVCKTVPRGARWLVCSRRRVG